jgi:hypothetical protein
MKSNINQLKIKNKAFIYYLEKDNIIFYIGKTKNVKSREADWKREYGENIKLHVIDECKNQKEIWKFWETYWIQQFKQWGFNLINKNEGGGGLNKHSDKTIEKIRAKKIGIKQNRTKIRKDKGLEHVKTIGIKIGAPKGFKMSEEAKLSKNLKQVGKPKHTKESKNKIGNFHKGKDNFGNKGKKLKEEHRRKAAENRYKPILQYSLDMNLIKEWNSLKEIKQNYSGDIGACCRGKQKTSLGYKWKYKNN